MAFANRLAFFFFYHLAKTHPPHLIRIPTYLDRDFFLVLPGKVDELIIFGADKERNGCLVEPATLAIPFLDRIQRTLPGQIEHEEDGDGVIANKRKHVHEFSLPTQVPDRECDFRIPDRDGLFHEIDAWRTVRKGPLRCDWTCGETHPMSGCSLHPSCPPRT